MVIGLTLSFTESRENKMKHTSNLSDFSLEISVDFDDFIKKLHHRLIKVPIDKRDAICHTVSQIIDCHLDESQYAALLINNNHDKSLTITGINATGQQIVDILNIIDCAPESVSNEFDTRYLN